jgi:hypothetical protein
MKVSKTSLRVYRSLYWANQGLLSAVAALQELQREPAAPLLGVSAFHDKLRRTQAMIEETRTLMNTNLAEWTGLPECSDVSRPETKEEE